MYICIVFTLECLIAGGGGNNRGGLENSVKILKRVGHDKKGFRGKKWQKNKRAPPLLLSTQE